MTPVVGAVLWGLLSLGGPSAHSGPEPDSVLGPGSEVPFVAQEPLLCGAAAVAMVERFWGVRGVYARDLRHLVRESEGGIRTSDLATALRDRGYRTRVYRDRPASLFRALEEGVPPILLLEGGSPRLHYVVLVALDEDDAWIHDPNFGPERRISRDELMRRWSASGHWALVAAPEENPRRARRVRHPSRPPDESPRTPSPALDSAMARLRADDIGAARAMAERLLRTPDKDHWLSRRVLATARYLEGDAEGALAEWNALGEPKIDLVRIRGLRDTRFQVPWRRMGLRAGTLLSPSSLALARRRLEQLPSVQRSRVDYQPLQDGSVEVRASVLEHRVRPTAPSLAREAARGILHRRVGLRAGPFLAAGDRWGLGGSWDRAQRYVDGFVSSPAAPLPGVVKVGLEWRRERYGERLGGPDPGADDGGFIVQERLRGSLGLEEWVSPRWRLGGSVGFERWEDGGRLVSAGLEVRRRLAGGAGWVSLGARGGAGSGSEFGRLDLTAGMSQARGDHREWRVTAGARTVIGGAPRLVWPGAGSGRIRAPLLRGHPLEASGAIRGAALGRTLLHATLEHRWVWRAGPVRLGGAVFADGAHVRSTAAGQDGRTFVDPGVGLLVGRGDQDVMVTVARGDSEWVVSTQLQRWR